MIREAYYQTTYDTCLDIPLDWNFYLYHLFD